MEEIQQCPAAGMERMMKLQDVLLKAMAKKITWWNQARSSKTELAAGAAGGDRRSIAFIRGGLLRLKLQHFHEKLQAEHGIELSYTWVQLALQGAG